MATDSEMIDALRVGAQTMDTLGRMVRMQENGVSPWWWHGAIMDEMERLAALDYPVFFVCWHRWQPARFQRDGHREVSAPDDLSRCGR